MSLPPTNKKPELLATPLLGSLVNRPAFGTFTATKSGAGAPFSEHLFFQTTILQYRPVLKRVGGGHWSLVGFWWRMPMTVCHGLVGKLGVGFWDGRPHEQL